MSNDGASSNPSEGKGKGKRKSTSEVEQNRTGNRPSTKRRGRSAVNEEEKILHDDGGDSRMDDGEVDGMESSTLCSICESVDPALFIGCDFCKRWFHGWCVDLRDEDFRTEKGHLWFDKYACPACSKDKNKFSTRGDLQEGGNKGLHYHGGLLWECVVKESKNAIWTCEAAISFVERMTEPENMTNLEHDDLQTLDLIVGYLHHLMIPMGKDKMLELFAFNAKLALKLVVAATDEYMRVRGWEQVDVLITLSKRDRWTPTAYRVEGTGVAGCNGEYAALPDDVPHTDYSESATAAPGHGHKFRYIKAGSPSFMLSRCKTEELENRWVISESGVAGVKTIFSSPPTSPADNSRPCRTGWRTLQQGTPDSLVSVTPADSCPEGGGGGTLAWDLAEWIKDNELLKKMFVDYVSPESVKHSSKLLGFMAMEDKLTNDHLTMMWRAGLNNGPEIETTVNEMLATLVMEMRSPLVVHLLKKMKDGPQDEAEKVLAFLACLVSMGGHSFLARDKTVRLATEELVWSLLKKPEVVFHESCKPVSTLLATARGEQSQWLVNFLERCIGRWRNSEELPDSVESVRDLLQNVQLGHVRQMAQLFQNDPERTNNRLALDDSDADENEAKVASFIAGLRKKKCFQCLDWLLDGLLEDTESDMFGVVSWRCKCKPAQKAHTACLFSYLSQEGRGKGCPYCKGSMTFGGPRLKTVRLHLHGPETDDPPTDDDRDDSPHIPDPTDR